MLKDFLERGKCFKLVCGAGNEDIEEIRRIVYIYALAGCKFFDISANEDVLLATKQSLALANCKDAYICISVGIKEDPHIKKAVIDYKRCINCGACEVACPQGAIHNAKVKKVRCIGCARCWRACSRAAITYITEDKNLNEIIPALVEKGIDCIELHAMGINNKEIDEKWKILNKNFDGLLSICTSRGKLSDEDLIKRIKHLISDRKPYSTLIQADGFPMSGGDNTYKATLQAVATGEVVQNENLPVYLFLSGGTNSKTAELANLCNVKYCGVAIGSYARKIIKEYTDSPDFWTNNNILEKATNLAEKLIKTVIE